MALLVSLCLPIPLGASQGMLVVESGKSRYDLAGHLEILEDKDHRLTITDVSTPEFSPRFHPYGKRPLNLGLSPSAYWIRFLVTTNGPSANASSRRWFLDLRNPSVESARIYSLKPGATKPQLLAQRDLWHPLAPQQSIYENMLFALPLTGGQPSWIYLFIDSRGPLFMPMQILTGDVVKSDQAIKRFRFGMYFGIMAVIFVYNLILAMVFRERNRVYYIFYIASTALYFATRDALTIEYVFRQRPALDFYATHISLGLLMLFILLFSKDFLTTRKYNRTLDTGLTVLIALVAAHILFIPIEDRLLAQYISTSLGLIVSATLLLTGVVSLRAGFKPARYYLISFVFFLSGAMLYALNYAGVLSAAISTVQGFQISSALQVILLSMAISDQVGELQRQKERAQAATAQALLRADALNIELQEYGRTLEQKVAERTEHLNQALAQLETLANTDVLTGLFNRRRFNEILGEAIDRCKRYGRPLSVIIFDIDHFKQVNDTYGHKTGDEVLKTLAHLVRDSVRRSDVLARWGGEEFVIVAYETEPDQGMVLAEKIRAIVERHPFPIVGRVTISLGIALYQQDDTEDTLMVRADNALYRAKENGRNRVESA